MADTGKTDPRVTAAVHEYADRMLAGQRFEPLDPAEFRTASLRRHRWPIAGLAAAAVLVAAVFLAPAGYRGLVGVPALPAGPPEPVVGLAGCIAGLQDADVDQGSARLTVGENVLIGYLIQEFSDGVATPIAKEFLGAEPTVSDLSGGQTVQLGNATAAAALWKAIDPDVTNGDFGGLAEWQRHASSPPIRPAGNDDGVYGVSWFERQVELTVGIECGDQRRTVLVRGTAMSPPGEALGVIQAFGCDALADPEHPEMMALEPACAETTR